MAESKKNIIKLSHSRWVSRTKSPEKIGPMKEFQAACSSNRVTAFLRNLGKVSTRQYASGEIMGMEFEKDHSDAQ